MCNTLPVVEQDECEWDPAAGRYTRTRGGQARDTGRRTGKRPEGGSVAAVYYIRFKLNFLLKSREQRGIVNKGNPIFDRQTQDFDFTESTANGKA